MTDAEQVACDALRSAGLDEVADNLLWVKAAASFRYDLLRVARRAAGSGRCVDCFTGNVHARDCGVAKLLHALDEGWSLQEIERARIAAFMHDMARVLTNATLRGDRAVIVETGSAVTRESEHGHE